MIVADRKPFEEIMDSIKDYNKIMIMGCGGCVTICFSGGSKAVEILSAEIKIARKKENKKISITEQTPKRQCEYEYIDPLKKEVESSEAILSTACGVGVQAMAERYPDKIIIPSLNTKFMGYPVLHAVWEERCAGCGDCVLEWTGAVCPFSRCAKKLLNGPCGGSADGKCEVDKDIDCAWQLIIDRLSRLGKLDNLIKVRGVKNWKESTNQGQRKVEFREAML